MSLEGLHNKAKTLKRQAYGIRDKEYFKLKVLVIHWKRYVLVGWTDFYLVCFATVLKAQ